VPLDNRKYRLAKQEHEFEQLLQPLVAVDDLEALDDENAICDRGKYLAVEQVLALQPLVVVRVRFRVCRGNDVVVSQ